MRISMRILAVAMLILSGLHGPAAARGHAHVAPPSNDTPARRWATDAALRDGMAGIRAAVGGYEHYQHGHMTAEQAVLLAEMIEKHANEIIAGCSLPPDADAALHAILVPLLQNAAVLKADPRRLDAIVPMREALAAYARQFDDPGAPSPVDG